MIEGSPLIHAWSIIFGIGTWSCVNGIWVELPILVNRLPEGWKLPSFMAIIVQLANLGPLLYTILHHYFPKRVTEKISIYFVLAIASVALLLMTQLWDVTTTVSSTEYSVAFFVLMFFVAAVDCSSRVLYLPFMGRFKKTYLTSYFIGEGLSGFIPSILAVVQGVGGNPECRNGTDGTIVSVYNDPVYSVEIFFFLLLLITICSGIAFMLLNSSLSTFAREKLEGAIEPEGSLAHSFPDAENTVVTPLNASSSARNYDATGSSDDEATRISDDDNDTGSQTVDFSGNPKPCQSNDKVSPSSGTVSNQRYLLFLLLLAAVSSLANGIFPSIQSYSCLPYGNVAYHWTVTLSNMANPSVCFLLLLLSISTPLNTILASVLSLTVACYVMSTAILSPNPPLVDTSEGVILLVFSWIVMVGIFTFVRVSIATILSVRGRRALFWCGAVTQIGSSVGALCAFCLVNYGDIFHAYLPCS